MATTRTKFIPIQASALIPRLFARVSWRRPRRKAHLDIRDLSPHLRRDMGLLDGNDPSGRRP